MDSKERILAAAAALIEENKDSIEKITVRDICQRASVGLGLVNYHFGNKDRLIELCVERMINGVVEAFQNMKDHTLYQTPREALECLGDVTFSFLFEHPAVSRISVFSDLKKPDADDNTSRTCQAFLPLVSACRPDWDAQTVRERTFYLITLMQQAFLRQDTVGAIFGTDLTVEENRKDFHKKILNMILEM